MRPPLEVRLTGSPASAAVRTVLLFCRLANIPCELTRTPITRLPDNFVDADVIVAGMQAERGTTFRSSSVTATLRFLAALRPALQGKWCGEDAAARAAVDEYLEWHAGVLRPASTRMLLLTVLHHAKNPARPADPTEVEGATRAYVEALQTLEARFLASEAFVAGASVTLADLAALPEVAFHRLLDVKLDASFPRVGAWLRKVAALRYWDEVSADFDEAAAAVTDAARACLHAEARKQKQQRSDAGGGTRTPDVAHVVRFPNLSAGEVYALLTDAERQTAAFKSRCTFTHSVGGEFSAYEGLVHGTNLYLEDGRKLLQRWRAADWPAGHFSMVRMQLREAEGGAELVMNHSDAPADQAKRLDELWNAYFWRPLDGVLTRGLAESVFIENASPHDVYDLLLDSARLSKLVHSKCVVGKAVGSEFELYDGAVTGRQVQLVTDLKIVQKWRGKDWPAAFFSHVQLDLTRVAGGTEIRFVQSDVPVERYTATAELWHKTLFKRLCRLDPRRAADAAPALPAKAKPPPAVRPPPPASTRLSRGGEVAAAEAKGGSGRAAAAAAAAAVGSGGAEARRPDGQLSGRDWALLFGGAKQVQLKKGDLWPAVRFGQSAPPRLGLFRVRSGELRLEGKRAVSLTPADGECGERQLFDSAQEALRARCASDAAEVASLEAAVLAAVLDSDEALATRFTRHYAARFARQLLALLAPRRRDAPADVPAPAPAATDGAAEVGERDMVLRTHFELPDALLLREWPCSKAAQPMAKAGALLVTLRHVAFYPRTVSGPKKGTPIAYAEVERVDRDAAGHRITVHAQKKKVTFQLERAHYDEVSAHFARFCPAPDAAAELRKDKFLRRFGGDSSLIFAQALLPEDWAALSAVSQVTRHAKGDVLMQEGKRHAKLFIVTAGACRLSVARPELKAPETRIETGELFGDAEWLLGGAPATYTVTADTDAEVRALPGDALGELLGKSPALATRFYLHLIGDLLVRIARYENTGRAASMDYLM